MSISKGVPAQPEDETNKEHGGNWVDVADVGAQGMSAALGGPRTSAVPSVRADVAPEVTAAAEVAADPAAAASTEAASSGVDGLSVAGDLAEGVLDVISGILDAN
jgi:hypothetical protein